MRTAETTLHKSLQPDTIFELVADFAAFERQFDEPVQALARSLSKNDNGPDETAKFEIGNYELPFSKNAVLGVGSVALSMMIEGPTVFEKTIRTETIKAVAMPPEDGLEVRAEYFEIYRNKFDMDPANA